MQNLTAATEIGTLFLDPDLRIRMSTPPIAELFNVTQADIGRTVTDFTHRLEYDGLAEDARRVLRDLALVEREIRSRSGRWYTMRLRPYRTVEDRIDGTVVTFVDITDRREAEAALRESELRFRALAMAENYSIYRMSPDWRLMHQLDGHAFLADTLGPVEDWADTYVLPEDRPAVFAAIAAAIRGKSLFELEHRVRRADGSVGWVFSRAVPILGPEGEIEEWFGAAADVTERRLAQERLRESEERLQQFGQASSDVLWIRDAETLRWEYLTPAFETIYGLGREQALGGGDLRHWAEFILPEDREQALRSLERVQDGERVAFEYRIRRASDGEVRWVRNVDFPMRDGAGRMQRIGGVGRDVTEEKQATERMGVLVAELQHRTRNLLAVVRSVAQRSIDPSQGLDEYDARLAALGRVQGFLSRSPDYRVPLADLVAAELRASGDGASGKVVVGGPAVELPGQDVQAVALALHELATNALKHGALGQAAGRLSVTWRLEATDGAGQHLMIEWQESGVAMPDEPPSHRGYGSELITRALPYQLRAKTALEFTQDGVRCRITLPASAFRTSKER